MAIVVGIVFLAVLLGGGLGLTYLIRYVGRERQVMYDADVARDVASTQPDPAFQQRQAEIEQNLADADALEAQVEASTPTTLAMPTPPATTLATPEPEPDATL